MGFGIHLWGILLCAMLALLVLGPQRLAKLAYQLGCFMQVLRRVWTEQQLSEQLIHNQAKAAIADRHYQERASKTSDD